MVPLRHRLSLLVALAAVLFGAPALSQAADGSVTGTVRDATGAALPGVTVTLTNAASGAVHTATTANDGTFSAQVPAGTYTVTASLRGFGSQTRKDVKVDAGTPATTEFSLEAGRHEEVTVTAMLRDQAVGDLRISIAAPTQDSLEEQGVDNIEGVAATVAGFSVQNLGRGQSQVAMRGVSAGQIVRDQPGVKEQVGAYLDDSIISLSLFTPDIDLFDVGRVEVLRGPQGTLFGAGSLSGTVRYISNQPVMGTRQWFGEFGGSTIDGGSAGGNFKLGGNVPLGEKAALRAIGYYNHMGGYIDAVQPNLSVKENVNTGDRFGVRAAVKV